jgi:hypothetical protein
LLVVMREVVCAAFSPAMVRSLSRFRQPIRSRVQVGRSEGEAMSLTCIHAFFEAPLHPWCEGCCAVPAWQVQQAQQLEAIPEERVRMLATRYAGVFADKPTPRPWATGVTPDDILADLRTIADSDPRGLFAVHDGPHGARVKLDSERALAEIADPTPPKDPR